MTKAGQVKVELVSPKEQHKGSPSSRVKTTYKFPKGKSPIRNSDWKDMSCLDLSDDPFQQVWNELDQVQSCYSKMELIIKGASRLLGDYKAGNISKEIKKLKEEDSSELKAHNAQLKIWVNNLQVTVKAQDKEIQRLRAMTEGIERIREFIGHTCDVVTKAHLFDNKVKTEDHLSA